MTNDKNIQADNGFGPIEKVDVFGLLLLRRKHLAGIKLKVSRGFFLLILMFFFMGQTYWIFQGKKCVFPFFGRF